MKLIDRIFAVFVLLIGAGLVAAGAWLAVLGGSLYYLLAGLVYVLSALLIWRGRRVGIWLPVLVAFATIGWALWESGTFYWALFPRVLVPAVLASVALLLMPGPGAGRARVLGLAGGVAIAVFFAAGFLPHGVTAPAAGALHTQVSAPTSLSDWAAYGRTVAGTRYVPYTQINRSNVKDLRLAWTYHTGWKFQDKSSSVDESTPLQIGNTLYTCTPNDEIAAIDADTGKPIWQHTAGSKAPFWQRCRGVSYYADRAAAPGSRCATRIVNATMDARIVELDAKTGQPCEDFGTGGAIDLRAGMGDVPPGFYFNTSAPLVARNRIVVGGWVLDNWKRNEPSGVIRAFDARTGALAWAWDLGNPQITALPPEGQTYTRGTPNMWTTAAYDDTLGLVYAPLGNATPDYFGMDRPPHSDAYNSALVALDIETGRPRWKFQTVHHDIWDYDLPSQPALVDLPDGDGKTVPAVLQTTKRGQLFLLDRATGEPLSKVVEKSVPQNGAAPEEQLSPTQPYSVDLPTIGADFLTEKSAWGMTMFDQLACRIAFKKLRYDGDFTPIGLTHAIEQPGNAGGMNWGSVAYDPVNHLAYMADLRIPSVYWLIPAADYADWAKHHQHVIDGHGPSPQLDTPYGMATYFWMSKLGVPCSQPPFGTITAVDLKTKKIAWQIPAGTAERLGPLGIPSNLPMPIGMPGYGGPMVTAGGLLFYAGFQDDYIRAYDAATGRKVWEYRLPIGASATPMSYVSPATHKQYVVISVGGRAHSPIGPTTAAKSHASGDYVMAFALPEAEAP